MNSDQRKVQRKALKYPARIDLCDGSAPRGCVIRDISASGARIFVDGPDEIPDYFHLLLAQEGSTARDCRVVWREGDQIGVEFVKAPPRSAQPRVTFKELMRNR